MKIKILSLLLLLSLLFTGCGVEDKKTSSETTPAEIAQPETPPERTDFRVLISSDIHCTFLNKWYGLSNEERMQHWVNSVLAEHAKQPIDLIIFAGDLSLDFWGNGGSYTRFEKSTTKEFIEKYVSQIPDEIAKLYLPGNHEAFANDMWREITGNDRACSYLLGNNLFICPDSFRVDTTPDYNTDGRYTPMDVQFIKGEMEKYPETNVFLVSHHFQMSQETAQFKTLLQNKRIVGLFQGHTHISDLITLGADCGYKIIAQSGHFAFSEAADPVNDFWGFREIVITKDGAVSSYIQVQSKADAKKIGKMIDVPARVQNVQTYKFK